mgnify:CR=1 FL=1
MTPYEAGMGSLVDLRKSDFLGRSALERADHRCRTWGLQCPEGVARHGDTLWHDGRGAGRVLSSAWSPTLQCGVAIVRMHDPEHRPGQALDVQCTDGDTHAATLCELPMYDRNGDIPRGRATELPEIPSAR